MADFPDTRASLLVRLRDPQDGTAWAEFVDLYAPLVYAYARKQGLQDADAADLSQDVRSERFPPATPQSWRFGRRDENSTLCAERCSARG